MIKKMKAFITALSISANIKMNNKSFSKKIAVLRKESSKVHFNHSIFLRSLSSQIFMTTSIYNPAKNLKRGKILKTNN